MKFQKLFITILILFLALTTYFTSDLQAASLYAVSGKVTYLRAHAIGSGWGPSTDFIDVEVVAKLDTYPSNAFGLQLRDTNDDTALRQAMFDILMQAYNNNWTVNITYWIDPGKYNGIIHRVVLSR